MSACEIETRVKIMTSSKTLVQALRSVATATLVVGVTSLAPAFAAGGGGSALETPLLDTSNKKSLQRGAQVFVNHCMGCHTADYHRYSRMAEDLGLDEEVVLENLIFTTDKSGDRTKIGSLMANSMTEDYGRQAFGVVPPNLALTARSRGADWIYTYMKSFYLDPERAGVGVNNTVYPGAAMPHVLWEYQGWQKPLYKTEIKDGKEVQVFDKFEQTSSGLYSPEEYDDMITDLTNFLAYLSDPIKHKRHQIGIYVMLFLFGLLALTWALKKEYWKDVVK